MTSIGFRVVRQADTDRQVAAMMQGMLDDASAVVKKEAAAAVGRIKTRRFGAAMGPSPMGPLRNRSRDARNSMGIVISTRPMELTVEVGAVRATPKVISYLDGTHEDGKTIRPKRAEMLAFPRGNAGYPFRDANGVQLLTAREFSERKVELGYKWIVYTPTAILARPEGSQEMEVAFVRKKSVYVPPRPPVSSEMPETVKNIEIGLRDL